VRDPIRLLLVLCVLETALLGVAGALVWTRFLTRPDPLEAWLAAQSVTPP